MQVEKIVLDEERHVSLTAYVQDVEGEFGFQKRPAMLVLPGGGYTMCSDREADPVATAYLKAGYQAFILRYTVKEYGRWPNPLNDYEEAMELIQARAEEWHVQADKIAVVGFSAGGHLAACAATVAKHRPAAAVLVYPAILKEIVDACQPGMPYPAEHVSEKTSPCFIVAARDDSVVPVTNAIRFMEALAEHQITFESSIYSYGNHGFSTAEEHLVGNTVCRRLPRWVADSIQWLEEVLGRFTQNGVSAPLYPAVMCGDSEEYLSICCTLGHIKKQKEEVLEIVSGLLEAIRATAKERNVDPESFIAAISSFTVKELMEMIQIPAEKIAEVDTALQRIKNLK